MLFVKYPYDGLVKTRLAEKTGPRFAAELYKNFVADTLKMLKNLPQHLKIFFDPPDNEENFKTWLGPSHNYVPQQGDDLGQKMKNAFDYVFAEGFSKALVIGSDTPDLPAGFIEAAFGALDSYDTVMGPANDGGYYLLGCSKSSFLPEAFEGITWSSHFVRPQTLRILKKHTQKIYLLPLWHDVDTLADLKLLLSRNKNTSFRHSKTFSFSAKHNLGGNYEQIRHCKC
jgi:hypothetical protein